MFFTERGHSEKAAVYKPGSESSPELDCAGILISDFPVSRTVRNKSVV